MEPRQEGKIWDLHCNKDIWDPTHQRSYTPPPTTRPKVLTNSEMQEKMIKLHTVDARDHRVYVADGCS